MKIDESSIGIILWVVLILVVNAIWISMDLWLKANGHEYLTIELREGLKNPLWGPIVSFLIFGTVAAFVFHMYSGGR